jgi:hypothetical protein
MPVCDGEIGEQLIEVAATSTRRVIQGKLRKLIIKVWIYETGANLLISKSMVRPSQLVLKTDTIL